MTVLLAVVLLYTVMGGMVSVLVTDYLQFLVMGLGLIITTAMVIHGAGWSHLISELTEAHRASIAVAASGGEIGEMAMAEPFNPFVSNG